MPLGAIREANKRVEKTTEQSSKKHGREKHCRFIPTQAAHFAKFAVELEHQEEFCTEI